MASCRCGRVRCKSLAVDVSSGVELDGPRASRTPTRSIAICRRRARGRRPASLQGRSGPPENPMFTYQQPDARATSASTAAVSSARRSPTPSANCSEAYARYQHDPGVPGRIQLRAGALRRPALAGLPCRTHQPRDGRRADLPQARRPQPHRRPQDQQRDRPGHAGAQAHGQAARDRRDRRRPARRGHGHDLRPLRPRMRGVHGQRGRQAPKPQRVTA